MSDLRELLQDGDHQRNQAEELERQARIKRHGIPHIGRKPEEQQALEDHERACRFGREK